MNLRHASLAMIRTALSVRSIWGTCVLLLNLVYSVSFQRRSFMIVCANCSLDTLGRPTLHPNHLDRLWRTPPGERNGESGKSPWRRIWSVCAFS
ncbi:hypothetical protein EG68_11651 [Paragonimus skrjabini miyazakii]|uniref:Uncharacterized protein n=1 Tax=Paragonimus skrjabini miyazakii TaxID=59628 RepID=A0A8S9Y9A5_9TREM|nr:hypothetical protein EG68_11651 [Paragonimus skrjabini miyazakii]